jgi:hypothetical protein
MPPRTTTIERRDRISVDEFTTSYLRKNRPLIVTDATASWRASEVWTNAYMRERFGDIQVALQGDYFSHVGTMSLAEYLDSFDDLESRVGNDGSVSTPPPYLRYSAQWGAKVREALHEDWSRPYFLPTTFYVIPLHLVAPDPAKRRYPDFGVYLSPRGALTKLHVDGDRTNAVLCQIQGSKRLFMYEPSLKPRLPADWARRKREGLNLEEPPPYDVPPTFDTVLRPGETIYIPRTWFHEVYTLERSISITFNFCHLSEAFAPYGASQGLARTFATFALDRVAGRIRYALRRQSP